MEEVGALPQRAAVGQRAREHEPRTSRPGTTSPTISPGRAPTSAARTASRAGATIRCCSASRSALWNGKDPILKERMFGLTNSEGNHGEDVKEYYFYLDSTPTHSYARMLYKYPQAAFPYEQLVAENGRRSRQRVRVRAAGHRRVRRGPLLGRASSSSPRAAPRTSSSASPRPTAGPSRRCCTCVPQLWFRNTWCARRRRAPARARGRASQQVRRDRRRATRCSGTRYLYCEGAGELLFTDNETNQLPPLGPAEPDSEYQKDGINDYIVNGRQGAVNPDAQGDEVRVSFARRPSRPGRARPCACA